MKSKFTYALLLLLCCTMGASSNRNATTCDAIKRTQDAATLTAEPGTPKASTEANAVVEATGYLPGLNAIFSN